MQVLVAYESRGGHTRQAAEAIAVAIRALGSEATVKSLKETTADDVGRSDAIAVGTWVEGFLFFGVGPAKTALGGLRQFPSLEGKRAAVFCTYGLNPRDTLAVLGKALEAKGAKVVAENAANRSHPDRGANALAKAICMPSGGS